MVRYAAFLRGINVGGHKSVKMTDLTQMFASLGLSNVKTYIQSGNVVFEAAHADPASLAQEIEAGLHKSLGYEAATMLRTEAELQRIVEIDPFAAPAADDAAKPYVTFLHDPLSGSLALPLLSPKQDIEVFAGTNCELFSLSRAKNGRFGFPNAFIESEFGVMATTRNWTTVCKVAALAAG